MKSHLPTAIIIIDKKKVKKDNTFPLKLRITFNRVRKYYSVGLPSLTESDFEKLINSAKLRDPQLKELRVEIEAVQTKARDVLAQLQKFSFNNFEKAFFQETENIRTSDVYEMLKMYSKKLEKEGRISTSQSYNSTLNSLKEYKKKLTFEEITPDFLQSYERFMLANGKSNTTIGIYLRSLRTIFNSAVDNGIVNKESYPFKKSKYQIPAGRNLKKALTKDEIKAIFDYSTIPKSTEDKAKDIWIFSYLCNGMNIKDICRLTYANIDNDKLTFNRAKTENTKKSNQKSIVVHLTQEAKAIIEKWGNSSKLVNNYIFPILEPNITPKRERELVQYFTKLVNKYMKRIAQTLSITTPLTTYTARHSFSTMLKRGGVSIEFISESLGHQNLKTTEAYLDSFDDNTRKQYVTLLTDF